MKNKKGVKGEIRGLAIQFIPYSDIRGLDSNERIKKILGMVLGNNIVVLQGRLKPDEETRLIGDTMAMIEYLKGFKGIELAVIDGYDKSTPITEKMKRGFVNALLGDISSITIIGPATVVKEIKRNPKKIELLLNK
ncbi:MAG: DUF2073 domain-containing protein [Nanoarchaeota archaeon]